MSEKVASPANQPNLDSFKLLLKIAINEDIIKNKKVLDVLKLIKWDCEIKYKKRKKYVDAYTNCDAQIIKGQGKFQTMPMGIVLNKKFKPNQYKKPIFFLMGIKAPMIEQSLKSILKEVLIVIILKLLND